MQTEHMYPAVGTRALRHRWAGGVLWPAERGHEPAHLAQEVKQGDPQAFDPKAAVWAFDTDKFTLGLSYNEKIARPELPKLSWALRDQNFQPTCVSQAVVACIELLKANSADKTKYPVVERLSVRFLYEKMREVGGTSGFARKHDTEWNQGFTSLADAKKALAKTGICPEHDWRDAGYLLESPSEKAEGNVGKFYKSVYHICATSGQREQVHPTKVIWNELKNQRPVAIALPAFAASSADDTSNNWNRESVLLTGNVLDPLKGETPVDESGHAVCVVGFLPKDFLPKGFLPNEDEIGHFVFRNSLGEDFASLPPPSVLGRGYGTISASHVDSHCWELLSLLRWRVKGMRV
jgi:hypothetical protein